MFRGIAAGSHEQPDAAIAASVSSSVIERAAPQNGDNWCGAVGGARAVEHLAHIAIEAEMAPSEHRAHRGHREAFASDGTPTDPLTNAALDIVLEDIAWWSAALKRARAEGQLKPGAPQDIECAAHDGRHSSPSVFGVEDLHSPYECIKAGVRTERIESRVDLD
jgi:hypothetical protein